MCSSLEIQKEQKYKERDLANSGWFTSVRMMDRIEVTGRASQFGLALVDYLSGVPELYLQQLIMLQPPLQFGREWSMHTDSNDQTTDPVSVIYGI